MSKTILQTSDTTENFIAWDDGITVTPFYFPLGGSGRQKEDLRTYSF
jgi:hypothetical protein